HPDHDLEQEPGAPGRRLCAFNYRDGCRLVPYCGSRMHGIPPVHGLLLGRISPLMVRGQLPPDDYPSKHGACHLPNPLTTGSGEAVKPLQDKALPAGRSMSRDRSDPGGWLSFLIPSILMGGWSQVRFGV